MGQKSVRGAAALDVRTPFIAARAVLRTVVRLSDDYADEEEAQQALIASQPREVRGYLETIARSSHSVFYHHLQRLYPIGRKLVPETHRKTFFLECGHEFVDFAFRESIYHVLQMALARPGSLQDTIVNLLEGLTHRYAGEKYGFSFEARPDAIVVSVSYRHPHSMRAYLRSYGLDPAECFATSLDVIAGALQSASERIVANSDGSRFAVKRRRGRGTITLPIEEGCQFAYDTLIPTLVGYISSLSARADDLRAEARLESDLIIESDLMRETWTRIHRAGRSEEIVLLRGESGTGKSFISRKIHESSPRSDGPFVEVGLTADIGSDNLIQSDLFGHEKGAFTGAHEHKQGLFSLADGGTIFLDEIGDASADLQAKLLRVLENQTFKPLGSARDVRVDARVILATNRDLEHMVEAGEFRRDLYYRINVISIELPPLRERREEIPALTEFLLARASSVRGAARKTLEPGLSECLQVYAWPGNIRELDHALKYAAAMCHDDVIRAEDLPGPVCAALSECVATPPHADTTARDAGGGGRGGIIDARALRAAVRRCSPMEVEERPSHEIPAHVDHARRAWLAALIDVCGGDLGLIGRYWDRGSEKTLRKLVRTFELGAELDAARTRRRDEG